MSQRPISLDLFHQNKVWRGASPVPSIPKEWYAGLPQSNTLFIWPQASVLPFRGLPAQKGGSFHGSLEKERRVLGFFCTPKLPCGSHGAGESLNPIPTVSNPAAEMSSGFLGLDGWPATLPFTLEEQKARGSSNKTGLDNYNYPRKQFYLLVISYRVRDKEQVVLQLPALIPESH
ncbi:hypothetical protein QYF36_018428 [Acer negundo]|nr:hypothetical protein QYF36_018428 [Acer negundo]